MRTRCSIAVWLVTLSALPCLAQSTATAAPLDPAMAIKQLGDPRFNVRERASRFLLQCGPAIEPLLTRAASSPDPEVSDRAKEILQDFSLGVLPETPAIVRQLLGQYLRSDVTDKEITLNQLSRQAGFGGLVILRLSQEELDPAVRAKADDLAEGGLAEIQRTARELVQASREDAAANLLQAAVRAGDRNSARALAAIVLQRSGPASLTALIQQLENSTAGDLAATDRLKVPLILLHRAAGDIPHALNQAGKADVELAWHLAVETGQWMLVASLSDEMGDSFSEPQRSAILATCRRFLGDQQGAVRMLTQLRSPEARDTELQGLLLNDQVQQAAELFAEGHEDLNAFTLLASVGRFDAAIALANRKDIPAEQQPQLQTRAAALRVSMGHPQAAIACCKELQQRVDAQPNFADLWQLCFLENDLATIDAAWNIAFQRHLLQSLTVAAASDDLTPSFALALPHSDAAMAATWWRVVSKAGGYPDAAQRLQFVKQIMQHKLSAEQLQALVGQPPGEQAAASSWLQWSAEEFTRLGRADFARQCVEQAIASAQASQRLRDAAHIAAANQWWTKTIDCVVQLGSGADARDTWLMGWATVKQGNTQNGQAIMRSAIESVLASDTQRIDLADQMRAVGEDEAAQEQYTLTSKLAEPGSWPVCVACQRLGDMQFALGKWAQAVRYWQRYTVMQITFNAVFDDFSENVEFPRAVHEAQARAALEAGDDTEALRQVRLMLDVNPLKLDPLIGLIQQLRASRPQMMRKIFDLATTDMQTLLHDYPDDALLHNNLAWFCTECGLEPELAMQHARRAAQLQPRETDSLDTLAEVCFRSGDRATAIKYLQQCREIDPDAPLWDQREKEFATTGR